MKKAQLTVFLMMAIVLLAIAGITFYAAEIMQKRVFVRHVEASSAKGLVEQCLGLVADDALLVIGRQGGYAELSKTHFEPLKTNYLYDAGEDKAPDILTVQQQLSDYIEAQISKCIGNFELLQEMGITVEEKSQPKIEALIADENVLFSINYALEEKKGDMVTVPEFSPAIKAVRLKKIIELARKIVESEQKNNGLFDLDIDCELDITHFPVEKTLITIITDNSFLIQDKPYRFVFAHRR
ncbi:MAG: hypothetical protein QXM31_04175 [Candidatus Woesearchaeota archaeon]